MDVKEWLGEDNQIGQEIWSNKYQYKKESFDEWLDRVSGGDDDIREEIAAKRFLFGGRILANRGLYKDGINVTYSNCYVLPPPEDNIESIYNTAGQLARTFSYGGGVGIDLSKLAPRGAKVNNTAKETSGAVSFMDLYALTTGLIGQAGRRGALMLSLDCRHPDLIEFIKVKSDLDKVTTANISLKINDDFMRCVIENDVFELEYYRPEVSEGYYESVDANEILDELAFQNWDMGEPGMLFWDTVNNWNLCSADPEFEYAGTNPCAEEPLPAYGSCLLGSINLSEFIENPYTDKAKFDVEQFKTTVLRAVKALNDVLDEGLPLHPLQGQRDTVHDWRQIGLGVFGVADMLVKLGIQYGSEQSLLQCQRVAELLIKFALFESCELAKQYGAYPKCNKDALLKSEFLRANLQDRTLLEDIYKYGLRNSQLLTIPPTGTLSTMLQTSGGLEPFFATSWTRTTKSLHGKDVDYIERPKAIQELLDAIGGQTDDDLPDYVVTSSQIKPIDRIYMQKTWQQCIDASISSTVNLPNSATVEDVKQIYIQAWKNKLKGITVFRDGCRRVGILSTNTKPEKDDEPINDPINNPSDINDSLGRGDIIMVNDDVVGKKRKLTTGCGSLHCTAFFDPITGDLCETYLSRGSTGGCANNMTAMSRMISLSARAGVDIDTIIDQLESCGVCPSYAVRRATHHDTSKGSCCPIAVGYALKDMWLEMQDELGLTEEEAKQIEHEPICLLPENTKYYCPECGEEIIFEGGCMICKNCGFSKCE